MTTTIDRPTEHRVATKRWAPGDYTLTCTCGWRRRMRSIAADVWKAADQHEALT